MKIKTEVLKKLFWKSTEIKPVLTPEQYKVYCKHIKEAVDLTKKSIREMIIKDIKYGKKQLTGTFQENKPWQWRITGMKLLLSKLEGKHTSKGFEITMKIGAELLRRDAEEKIKK